MRDVVKRILEELKQAKEAGEPDAWKLPIKKKDLWAIIHALEEDDARITSLVEGHMDFGHVPDDD